MEKQGRRNCVIYIFEQQYSKGSKIRLRYDLETKQWFADSGKDESRRWISSSEPLSKEEAKKFFWYSILLNVRKPVDAAKPHVKRIVWERKFTAWGSYCYAIPRTFETLYQAITYRGEDNTGGYNRVTTTDGRQYVAWMSGDNGLGDKPSSGWMETTRTWNLPSVEKRGHCENCKATRVQRGILSVPIVGTATKTYVSEYVKDRWLCDQCADPETVRVHYGQHIPYNATPGCMWCEPLNELQMFEYNRKQDKAVAS